MTKTTTLLIALSLASPACGELAAEECQSSWGTRSSYAIAYNAISYNAMTFNAISWNAITWNGVNLNAIGWNAMSFNGATLRSAQLDGGEIAPGTAIEAVTDDGTRIELGVASTEVRAGRTWARLELEGQPLCQGDGFGVIVEGIWDLSTGARHDAIEIDGQTLIASYSCAEGVIGKCIVWGYDPTAVGADVHQTCTRLARADYCGDGISYTDNGTMIDVYDRYGFIEPDTQAPEDFAFEAGWGPQGAMCVNRPRYDIVQSDGNAVLPHCWAELPRCESFQEARALGAELGNDSGFAERTLCE